MICDTVMRAIVVNVLRYRVWLTERPFDFQKNCSRTYMIDRITESITGSVTDKNFTIAELKDAIDGSIDRFDFKEVIEGRTYTFTKPVMA